MALLVPTSRPGRSGGEEVHQEKDCSVDVVYRIGLEDALVITFHESTLVEDRPIDSNKVATPTSKISRSLQCLPLSKVQETSGDSYNNNRPEDYILSVKAMTGLAIHTHAQSQEEAFKIEIMAGDVNIAYPETKGHDESYQGYFFGSRRAPEEWIDGVAVAMDPRRVQQFVALRHTGRTGYSIHEQAAKKHENSFETGMLTVNITRGRQARSVDLMRRLKSTKGTNERHQQDRIPIFLKEPTGRMTRLEVRLTDTIGDGMLLLENEIHLEANNQRWLYKGANGKMLQCDPDNTFEYYQINKESIIHLVLRFFGGGPGEHDDQKGKRREKQEVEIWPGGHILQDIHQDPGSFVWNDDPMCSYKIRLVDRNDLCFHHGAGSKTIESPFLEDDDSGGQQWVSDIPSKGASRKLLSLVDIHHRDGEVQKNIDSQLEAPFIRPATPTEHSTKPALLDRLKRWIRNLKNGRR